MITNAALSPEDALARAKSLSEKGDSEEAISLLKSLPHKAHTAQTLHALGNLYRETGHDDEAIEAYQSAVNADNRFYPSFAAAAEVFAENGLSVQAMDCYGCAVIANPQDAVLKERFLDYARFARFTTFNPQVRHLFIECLKTARLDLSFMGHTFYSLLLQDPAVKKMLEALNYEDHDKAHAAFSALPDHNAAFDEFFNLCLERCVIVPELAFERALTNLRRLLLAQVGGEEIFQTDADVTTIGMALGHYCYHTEYIFALSDEEEKSLPALRNKAASGDDAAFAVLACYEPLHQLPDAEKIADGLPTVELDPLIKMQITDPLKRRTLQTSIPQLTPITAGVSDAVRQQYEESPYPAWTDFRKTLHNEEIEGRLRGQKSRILVAGCGTGREPVELAYTLPDADVLAIDLSTASIAYGMMKAEEYGIKNLTFKQADILKLGEVGLAPFDYIASSGVIHHMEDPLAGWNILTGLLKPGGLMRLCLYSRLARESLYVARDVIADRGYAVDPDGIRQFRTEAQRILKHKDYAFITEMPDYYQMSECRDLLFHVQEYAFTIEEIADYLAKNSLDFLGFYVSGDTLMQYFKAFPGDPDALDLTCWAKFERKHPLTFTGMYRMWLEKV